jgi:hypothetical protein
MFKSHLQALQPSWRGGEGLAGFGDCSALEPKGGKGQREENHSHQKGTFQGDISFRETTDSFLGEVFEWSFVPFFTFLGAESALSWHL